VKRSMSWVVLVVGTCTLLGCDMAHYVYVAPEASTLSMGLAPVMAEEKLHLGRRLGFETRDYEIYRAGQRMRNPGECATELVGVAYLTGFINSPPIEPQIFFYSADGGRSWAPVVVSLKELWGEGPGRFGNMTMLVLLNDPKSGR
jgi:hypothetical protein